MIDEDLTLRLDAGYVILPNGCWQWIKSYSDTGYGRIQRPERGRNRIYKAHRVSYQIYKGEIPTGLHLDHTCFNRGCVNPEHLEAVTPKENTRRAADAGRMNKSHCLRGHALTGENLYYSGRNRRCRACQQIRSKEYYERSGREVWANRHKMKKAGLWPPADSRNS